MGAAFAKACFVGECFESPADATPRTRRPDHKQRLPHHSNAAYVNPRSQPRLNNSHSRESLRNLDTQQWFATEHLKTRTSAMVPKPDHRERWGSRESTCSSSSGTEDDTAVAIIQLDTVGDINTKTKVPQPSRRRVRASANVRPWVPEHSLPRAQEVIVSLSNTSAPPRRKSSRRSSSDRFEDLLPEHYVLEDLVGSGTTSKCYRCRRTTDNRTFACKIINKRRLAFDGHQRADIAVQLRREIDVLRRLDHPNIAKLEDAYENDTFIILVMELLNGGELFDVIIDRVRLTEADAKHVAHSVLSAMTYMHAQGIVHRDLKPENLLLASSASSPGSPLQVKIIDFGFASSVGTQTKMTSFLGTGGYLAPEILLQRPYTEAVDTWSFGVLLYLMLCGRLPFATSTQILPGQRISKLYRLTFPDKYWNGVSVPARDLLQKLLVLNPSYRLSTADALNHPWFHSD